jgi:proteasome lid subunit RPN8/RPN11
MPPNAAEMSAGILPALMSAGFQPAISSDILRQIEEHAASSNGEVCGFVYDKHYVPLPNLSSKEDQFYGDPSTLARILFQFGEPVAIFHTHPNGCLELSVKDKRMWYYSNSTMIVGCVRDGRLQWKTYGKPGD